MSDHLSLRRIESEIRNRVASGKGEDALPPVSVIRQEQAGDDAARRAVISHYFDEAERGKSPVQKAKAEAFEAGDDRQVDVARAWAAHEGKSPNISVESPGARAWAKQHGLEREIGEMQIAQRVAESDEVKNTVNRQAEFARTINDGLQRTAIGAATRALAGHDSKEEITRIENQFAEDT